MNSHPLIVKAIIMLLLHVTCDGALICRNDRVNEGNEPIRSQGNCYDNRAHCFAVNCTQDGKWFTQYGCTHSRPTEKDQIDCRNTYVKNNAGITCDPCVIGKADEAMSNQNFAPKAPYVPTTTTTTTTTTSTTTSMEPETTAGGTRVICLFTMALPIVHGLAIYALFGEVV